ncbi:MAG TPA: DUF1569 domain-containing protein [Vicinamibacterales bacterium]|jgi:hypothetical protein
MKTLARERDAAEILRRLDALRAGLARRWGRMSVHQMVCHLTDSCRMLTGERTMPPAATPLPKPMMRWIALYLPMRWPPGIQTTPELDQTDGGGTPPIDFAADVVELKARLRRIANDPDLPFTAVHPVFGRMSRSAWYRWAYLHADHHLRQFGL